MKRANRPPRPKRFFTFTRDHDCRSVIALNDSRRRDADHAAMPSFAIDDDAVSVAQRGIAGKALFDRLQYAPLFFLTFGIELVELRR
jgi:hypothetical protein